MPTFTDKGTIYSLPDAIARILEEHITPPQLEAPVALAGADAISEPASPEFQRGEPVSTSLN